ncbi:1-phosphofructokinase family hexose kinase [Phenylobacterium sp.]|uniref:1-phosphofructokinase family hexose kinase n=1 Tax=Phenylobacterium sp. TaxID=1871053 RepID=UPI002723FDDB|nr:1-phosphofructokinase family hexose kinase [Phenylobacterium sp.]MDO8380245.1 1-phosphofructokinase family hexose kinase [Phenylobacterium sp.]
MTRARAAAPVIATLTLNPAVDLSAVVDRLEPERKLRCHDLRRDPGGGGINVARVIRRLGGQAVAAFVAGGVGGERLRALLATERVPVAVVPTQAETRENFTAHDLATGQEYRFVMPGAPLRTAEQRSVMVLLKGLTPAPEILVLSGSLPPDFPLAVHERLIRQARRAGVRLVLDASGQALTAGLAAGVWLVKPNLRELEDLCGRPLPDLASRLAACREIIAAGGAAMVALSLGREGALLVTAERAWRARPLDIVPVSTIGAGDSFLAGLVWALGRGLAPPEALRWAVATASATLLAPGTSLCRRADVLRLRRTVTVEAVG